MMLYIRILLCTRLSWRIDMKFSRKKLHKFDQTTERKKKKRAAVALFFFSIHKYRI